MPPNCVREPEKDCIGYAEAQIIKASMKDLKKTVKSDRKKNRKDHKEFYSRLEFGEKAQALTQQQLAQILDDTNEIKTDLKDRAQDLTTAIEKQNTAIHDTQMKPAKRWDGVVDKIILTVVSLVVSAVVSAIIVAIGLGGGGA